MSVSGLLSADTYHLIWLYSLKRLKYGWNERKQVLKAVRYGHDDNDANSSMLEVLLVFEILICGDEYVKPCISGMP